MTPASRSCPHCGAGDAPASGWCLDCGQRVDGAGPSPATAAAPSSAVPPTSAPARPSDSLRLSEANTDTVTFDDLEPISQPVAGPGARSGLPVAAPAPATTAAPLATPELAPLATPELAPLEPSPARAPVRAPVASAGTAAPRIAPIAPIAPVAAAGRAAPRLASVAEKSDSRDVTGPIRTVHPLSASPHAALHLSARYEYTSIAGDQTPLLGVLVELTASGRPLRDGANGAAAHVILALDVSASMNKAAKFPVLEDALRQLLADLRRPDSPPVLVSVVIFAKGAAAVLRAADPRKTTDEAVLLAIRSHPLLFGRYTDTAGAIALAGRIAAEQARAVRTMPVRIYLMTDGRPQDMGAAKRAMDAISTVPADVHALAFGRDADVPALQSLFAGRRGGTVKSVTQHTLGDAFERIGEAAKRTLARRCEVSVELDQGTVGGAAFRYRPARVRFPDPAFEGGKRFRTDLGSLEADRAYSLLIEVRPPETSAPVSRLGRVTVRIPGFGGPIEQSAELTLARTSHGSEPGDADNAVQTARDILSAVDGSDPAVALRGLRLRRTIYEAERRDPGLLAILDRAIEVLEKTGSLDSLSPGEMATLRAHTCTAGGETAEARRPVGRRAGAPAEGPPAAPALPAAPTAPPAPAAPQRFAAPVRSKGPPSGRGRR